MATKKEKAPKKVKAAKKVKAKKVNSKQSIVDSIPLPNRRALRASMLGKSPIERTALRRQFATDLKAARRARVAIVD